MLSFWPQFKHLQLSSVANNAERQKPLCNANEISKKGEGDLNNLDMTMKLKMCISLKKKSEYSSEKFWVSPQEKI